MNELVIEYGRIRDESRLDRNGNVVNEKLVTFYIGPHGPFHERFPADGFTQDQVRQRVEALRRELQNLPR